MELSRQEYPALLVRMTSLPLLPEALIDILRSGVDLFWRAIVS